MIFRHALRQLRRNPGFALAATLALAIGIGANTAMFSVVDGVLLRPLPYDESDRLVQLRSTMNRGNLKEAPLSRGDFWDYQGQNKVFTHMAGFGPGNVGITSPTSDPERVGAAVVTDQFFDVLRTKPALGRIFGSDEFQPGKDGIVVLSDGLWRERYAADPRVLGQSITIDGRARQIIGVMPPGFAFPATARVWLPHALVGEERVRRDLLSVLPIARLKDGVSVETAQAQLTTMARQLEAAHPEFNAEKGIKVTSLLEASVGQLKPAFLVLLGAVGMVLLIACANVANLLLARGASRQTEFTVRAALGAGRAALMRQMLGESMVLAAVGGAGGLAVAYGLFAWLTWLAPANLPRLDQIALNGRALVFIFLVTLLTGVIFGLAPALKLSRVDLHADMKQRGGSRGALRSGLVVAQIAAALILLIGAGLLMRTFVHLQQTDLGFDPENLLTLRVQPLGRKYGPNQALQVQFARQLQEGLRTLPGVQSVGIATDLPLLGGPQFIMRFEGRPPVSVAKAPIAAFATVTPEFFSTMGVRLKRGRFFAPTDTAGRPMVAIVNETLVKRYFPNEDPIGKRLEIGFSDPPNWREIVGVVGDMKNTGLDQPSNVQVYGAYEQQPGVFPGVAPALSITARTQADPGAIADAARKKVLEIDRSQPVYAIQTMSTVVAANVAQKRFALLLMALFAGIALLLAAIGLAGVMSYLVAQRTREIGIRMAIGAEPRQVLWMVQAQALRLTLAGVAVGLAGAWWFSRWLETMLVGVSPRDPLTFAGVALALVAVAGAAAFWPARRATRIDPVAALRRE